MKMYSQYLLLSQLTALLLVCFATIRVVESARPGFIYTRTRGKCTPLFWSRRREAWPRMVPETASVAKVFGSRAFEHYRSDLTLAEAAGKNDNNNAFERLAKESTAALLNSYARKENFPFSPWEVKTMLIQGLVSEQAALLQAQRFSQANEACN